MVPKAGIEPAGKILRNATEKKEASVSFNLRAMLADIDGQNRGKLPQEQ
jgi:hypothetical protein